MAARKTNTAAASTVARSREALLNDVAVGAFNVGNIKVEMLRILNQFKTVKGKDGAKLDWSKQEDVKQMFYRGYMAARMFPGHVGEPTFAMISSAAEVLNTKGYVDPSKGTAKGGTADKRRTKEQERWYGNARQAWSDIINLAGLSASDARGGNNNQSGAKATRAPQTATVPAAVEVDRDGEPVATPVAPAVVGPVEAVAYFKTQAATMLAYTNKHAKVIGPQAREAVRQFHLVMKGLEVVEATKCTN
jgi:hypothetical protein